MATLPSPPADLTPEQLYLGHLKLIDKVSEHAAWRRHLSREETQDFVSTVRLKLLEDSYVRICKFQGISTFATYITFVIGRLLQDYCNHLWGKWRPSMEAKRLGAVALRLEVLLYREWRTLDDACKHLWTNEHIEMSREQLDDLAVRIPPRTPRQIQGVDGLEEHPDDRESPDKRVMAREREERLKEIHAILNKALASLPAEDRLIVKMRSEHQVAQIARSLGLEQKPLYGRIAKIYETLCSQLEKDGVSREEIRDLLSGPETDLEDDS